MRLLKWCFLLLAIVLIVGTVTAARFYSAVHKPINADQPVFFTVESGATLKSVAAELEDRGVIPSSSQFIWLARVSGNKPVLATDYQFPVGTTIRELYTALSEGTMRSPERQITIIEGLTLKQTAQAFAEAGFVPDAETFITAASTNLGRFRSRYEFLASKPESATLEGYLFPDTYRFLATADTDDLIVKMLDTFDRRLSGDMREQIRASGRTIHEALTLASIVEREVRTPDEMNMVAGLFLNRLEIGMALQADSTVNYLTESGRDRSTYEDLEIDSPYNTYKYAGLPPGPISNPGLNALNASANPTENDYLYFLTDSKGTVYYAKTHDGHLQNRTLYLD